MSWIGKILGGSIGTVVEQVGMVTASKLNIRTASRLNARPVAPPLLQGTVVDIFQETNG